MLNKNENKYEVTLNVNNDEKVYICNTAEMLTLVNSGATTMVMDSDTGEILYDKLFTPECASDAEKLANDIKNEAEYTIRREIYNCAEQDKQDLLNDLAEELGIVDDLNHKPTIFDIIHEIRSLRSTIRNTRMKNLTVATPSINFNLRENRICKVNGRCEFTKEYKEHLISAARNVANEYTGHYSDDYKFIPLGSFGWTARTVNCLSRAGISCLGHLLDKSDTELRKIRNLGRLSLKEIKLTVHELGFILKDEQLTNDNLSKCANCHHCVSTPHSMICERYDKCCTHIAESCNMQHAILDFDNEDLDDDGLPF